MRLFRRVHAAILAIALLSVAFSYYLILNYFLLVDLSHVKFKNILIPDSPDTSNATGAADIKFTPIDDRKFQWFMQLSDTHISIKTKTTSRQDDLVTFLTRDVGEIVQPPVLLVTGDLVHATDFDNHLSHQWSEEWRLYREAFEASGILKNTRVLDLLGNHDSFSTTSDATSARYAIHAKNEVTVLDVAGSEPIHFIPIALASIPGLGKPFNFIGKIQDEKFVYEESVMSPNPQHRFFYGHYPSSTISKAMWLRPFLRKYASAYFSGHLHNGYGWLPDMVVLNRQRDRTNHGSSYLEAELADWKDHRMFRICAVDNGVFAYRDFEYSATKNRNFVVPTYPKPLSMKIPDGKEPAFDTSLKQLRFALFSKSRPKSVTVKYVPEGTVSGCNIENSPLVVCDISERGGNYSIFVDGAEIGEYMSLAGVVDIDAMEDTTHLFMKFVLMTYYEIIAPGIYYSLLLATWLFLYKAHWVLKGAVWPKLLKGTALSRYIHIWLCFAAFGPWWIGRLSENYIGIVFPWSIFTHIGASVQHHWEPSTYFAAGKILISFWFPFVLALPPALTVQWRTSSSEGAVDRRNNKFSVTSMLALKYYCNIFYIILALVNGQLARVFSRYYGWFSLFSPFNTGGVVLCLYFLYFFNTHQIMLSR